MRALLLGIGQLDDPACAGVLARSVGLTLVAYAALIAGGVWGIHHLLANVQLWAWVGYVVSTVGVLLLAFWLFLPTVMLIATLYIDRVADAVDRRHYPFLPPPTPAALHAQLWDGLALAAQVLILNAVSVVAALLLPGVGLALAVLISGWAIGRGLFVAVAMRRVSRTVAQRLYADHRVAVLVPGLVLAAASTVPGVNLLVPIVGTAAMVHVLNRVLSRTPPGPAHRTG